MTNQLKQIIAFCSKRYKENHGSQPGRATTHLLIAQLAGDLPIGYAAAEPMLLDFISHKQNDPDLAKACMEVLEHLGNALGS